MAKQHGLNLSFGLASFPGVGLRADAEGRDGHARLHRIREQRSIGEGRGRPEEWPSTTTLGSPSARRTSS